MCRVPGKLQCDVLCDGVMAAVAFCHMQAECGVIPSLRASLFVPGSL